MARDLGRNLRYVGFLAIVTLFTLSRYGSITVSARYDGCDDPEVCGPGESCDTPCQVDLNWSTCGEFGGLPIHPIYGNCLGTCGDGYCNPFNEEDYTNCFEDCGYCGDDVCQRFYEAAGTGYCESDCGPNGGENFYCDPTDNDGCSSGDFCTALRECVEISSCNGGDCNNNSDCCANEYCYSDCTDPQMCGFGHIGVCLEVHEGVRR